MTEEEIKEYLKTLDPAEVHALFDILDIVLTLRVPPTQQENSSHTS